MKSELRTSLEDRMHATSAHALREWKHIVDRSAAEIVNADREEQHDLASVFARLSQGHGRRAGQRMRVLSLLTAGRNELTDDLPIRASAVLRYGSRRLFHHRIDTVRDGSKCGLAREEVRSDGRRLMLTDTCLKSDDDICDQLEFMAANEAELQRAGAALQSQSDSGLRALGKLCQAAADSPRDGKGRNCYAGLGDVCIALECGSDETLLTTDRAFEVLGTELGFRVCRFEATRAA
jgi:hypothetical protein